MPATAKAAASIFDSVASHWSNRSAIASSSMPLPRLSQPSWPSLLARGYYRDGTRSAENICRALAVSLAIER